MMFIPWLSPLNVGLNERLKGKSMYQYVELRMGYCESESLNCVLLRHGIPFDTPQQLMESLYAALKAFQDETGDSSLRVVKDYLFGATQGDFLSDLSSVSDWEFFNPHRVTTAANEWVSVARANEMDEYLTNGDWGECVYLYTRQGSEIEWFPSAPKELPVEDLGGDCEGED